MGNAFAFGLTTLSGTGCVILAIKIKGSLWKRCKEVLVVYTIIGIGMLLEACAQPLFITMLPDNLYLFTGIFLIGLGFWLSGVQRLQNIATRVGFQAAINVMIVASIIHGLIPGISWNISPGPNATTCSGTRAWRRMHPLIDGSNCRLRCSKKLLISRYSTGAHVSP